MTQPRRDLHHCYHRHGKTDLSVFRRDAEYRAKDPLHPRSTVIHIHAQSDEAWPACTRSYVHEFVYTEADLAQGK